MLDEETKKKANIEANCGAKLVWLPIETSFLGKIFNHNLNKSKN